jgi:hypothetical protein
MAKNKNSSVGLRSIPHPVLYEINTRVLCRELSASSGAPVTLANLPESLLESWKGSGIDALWLMGVWSSGPEGIAIARQDEELRSAYGRVLPGFTDDDIGGSPYALHAYEIPDSLGGEEGLSALRARLAEMGIGIVLDFVPNHTARDHPWVHDHPGYYVQGGENDAAERPGLFFRARTVRGPVTIAMGRDPSFAGWTDTAQVNVFNPDARAAMIGLLGRIAGMCDGVRCDMAMLVLNSVFAGTWGKLALPMGAVAPASEFWKEAIGAVRAQHPEFMFIAEAYWNLEWELQQLGFDYTYDKTLYDRLLREGAGSVRDHLRAEMEYQKRSLRFIENHDEPRAASALASEPWLFAASAVIAMVPGMAMFHEGQFEGRRVRLPVQLTRRPREEDHPRTRAFYSQLLAIISTPPFREGSWRLLMPRAAWHDNYTWGNFLLFWWHNPSPRGGTRLVVINYAPLSGQCYVDIPLDDVPGSSIEFHDLLSEASYVRDRHGLASKGIYFDIQPYGIHIFEVSSAT